MGELPERVFVTGAPGLDHLAGQGAALSAGECRAALGLPAGQPFVLVLFHPVVQQACDAATQTGALLRALRQTGLPVLWGEPNADAGSAGILEALDTIGLPDGSRRTRNLPRALFCAAMKHCAVMVGNSSAGIIEAATFGTPVVNVGDRQRLRERNANVNDATPEPQAIATALATALVAGRRPCNNRYGDGQAGPRIARLVAELPLSPSVLEKINSY